MSDRRDFLKKAMAGTVGLTIGSKLSASSARSYNSISGANEVIRVAIIGCNSRGSIDGRYFCQAGRVPRSFISAMLTT